MLRSTWPPHQAHAGITAGICVRMLGRARRNSELKQEHQQLCQGHGKELVRKWVLALGEGRYLQPYQLAMTTAELMLEHRRWLWHDCAQVVPDTTADEVLLSHL